MKRKFLIVGLSVLMTGMVWQMVIAKVPSSPTIHKFGDPLTLQSDSTKGDSAEAEVEAEIILETPPELDERMFSRKYIPPTLEEPPKRIAKQERKEERRLNKLKKKKATLAEATPE